MKKNDLYELSYELKQEFKSRLLLIILFCVLICTFISLVLHLLVFPVRQKSVSMEPSVSCNSFVLINRFENKKERGQIVLVDNKNKDAFSKPVCIADVVLGFFTGQQYFPLTKRQKEGNTPSLRRVVGIPGDTIYMKDYVLYIKPAGEKYFLTEFEFVKRPYNVSISLSDSLWDKSLGTTGNFAEFTLGADEFFVLSDNRVSSVDSRLWGPVKDTAIVGKAEIQYFPFNSFRFL